MPALAFLAPLLLIATPLPQGALAPPSKEPPSAQPEQGLKAQRAVQETNHQEGREKGVPVLPHLIANEPAAATTDPAEKMPALASSQGQTLAEGLVALEELDLLSANAAFEKALSDGPYSWAEAVKLYAALGIVRAYLEDEAGALDAFDHLLAIDPSHSLAYTTSPKATFLFERIRNRHKTRRSTEVRVTAPAVVPFDGPIEIEIFTAADPLRLIDKIVVFHRLKGETTYHRISIAAPKIGERKEVKLPPQGEAEAFTDASGQVGLIVELAVVSYDDQGWEVQKKPAPERPIEIPVGFNAPGPWYTQWWIWAAGGAAFAVVAASIATVSGASAAAWYTWPAPDTVTAVTPSPAGTFIGVTPIGVTP